MDNKLKVIEWLLEDDNGLSSKVILKSWLGLTIDNFYYPEDPSDLGRCLRFLRKFPEAKEGLLYLSEKCQVWNNYIENWATLEKTLIDEVGHDLIPIGQKAHKTYSLMKTLKKNVLTSKQE